MPNRPRPAKTPMVEAESAPIIDLTNAPEASPPRERLLLLGTKVIDMQFIIPDVLPT